MGGTGVAATAVGVATVESIPLFHYRPGSLALRVYTGPHTAPEGVVGGLSCRGDAEFEVCEWLETPGSFPAYRLEPGVLGTLARRWGVESVFIDGLESWRASQGLTGVRLPLAARTQGLGQPGARDLEGLEALVGDSIYPLLGEARLNRRLARTLEEARDAGVWVEVVAYLETPELPPLAPALDTAVRLEAPLHVYIWDHRGGGGVSRLYTRLSRSHWPVYIHSPPHSMLDTACRSCGTIVATRSGAILTAMELGGGGSCPRCGAPIPVAGGWRKGTPQLFRRVAPEGVYWVDPRSLGGRP